MIAAPLRASGCPASAELEAHAAGDEPRLAEHVTGCATCGPYVLALQEASAAFLRQRPPELFLKKLARRAEAPPPRPWWRWLAVLGPVGAAVVLSFVLRTGPEQPDGVTLKGEPLRVFLKRGEAEPRALKADEVVRAGDSLRFSFDAPADGYLAVLELDGTEGVTVFFPFRGGAPAPVKQSQGLVPGAVVLDDKPGPEWLVGVWAPAPFDTAALATQLRGQATRDRLSVSCPGCVVSTLRLSKPRP